MQRRDDSDGHSGPHGSLEIAPPIGAARLTGAAVGRLLIPLGRPIRPSRMVPHRRCARLGAPWLQLPAAFSSAVAVGLASEVAVALHNGPEYGATLALFFGLVAGVSIAIAGGLLRWLNQPTVGHVVVGPVLTRASG